MLVWKNVADLCEGLCESTYKLAILNMLAVSGLKKFEDIVDHFDYPELTPDLISMEESGVLCRTRQNELEVTKFGHAFLVDLDDMAERRKKDKHARP